MRMLQNSGIISAAATGDIANASGAIVLGAYGVQVDNTGTISAAAFGADATATAVSMESNGSNTLTNAGTIGAFGDGARIAVSSSSGATSIVNSGAITGAILTGDLDDSLDNATGAIWHAVGDSDFGAGDDHIVNHGTIFMTDSVIRLGGYVNGNSFDNFGTLAVSGAGNVLDMGNPFPVNNNGVITFVDGAADDVLTIVGDFAGQGAINVDVSGLNQSSDRLYIDGNVIGADDADAEREPAGPAAAERGQHRYRAGPGERRLDGRELRAGQYRARRERLPDHGLQPQRQHQCEQRGR